MNPFWRGSQFNINNIVSREITDDVSRYRIQDTRRPNYLMNCLENFKTSINSSRHVVESESQSETSIKLYIILSGIAILIDINDCRRDFGESLKELNNYGLLDYSNYNNQFGVENRKPTSTFPSQIKI